MDIVGILHAMKDELHKSNRREPSLFDEGLCSLCIRVCKENGFDRYSKMTVGILCLMQNNCPENVNVDWFWWPMGFVTPRIKFIDELLKTIEDEEQIHKD